MASHYSVDLPVPLTLRSHFDKVSIRVSSLSVAASFSVAIAQGNDHWDFAAPEFEQLQLDLVAAIKLHRTLAAQPLTAGHFQKEVGKWLTIGRSSGTQIFCRFKQNSYDVVLSEVDMNSLVQWLATLDAPIRDAFATFERLDQ